MKKNPANTLKNRSDRRSPIYVSNGSGMPGRYDTLDGPGIEGNGSKLFDQIAVGAVIETATAQCTRNLQRRMRDIGRLRGIWLPHPR